MIEVTRLGQHEPFLLNPDLIERIDVYADRVIRLTNGIEYVVVETADEIVERIIDFRRRTNAAGPVVSRPSPDDPAPRESAVARSGNDATVVELSPNREVQR